MSDTNSLQSTFTAGKEELATQLKKYKLPKDAEKIQRVVDTYLNKILGRECQFRQNLTESEDYILLSALQILKSQQEITFEISKSFTKSFSGNSSNNGKDSNVMKKSTHINPYVTLAGTGVGAIVGGLAGSWGAAIGAIAGTAIAIYLATRNTSEIANSASKEDIINVDIYLEIVEKICESIDNVIDTYRVQIKKVKNSYERREKPSLLNEYSALTNQVANVCKTAHFYSDTIPNKLLQAVEMMQESLENYDLKYEDGEIVPNE